MKKHEEMKERALAYANVASYVDTCIEDAKADNERYKELAMQKDESDKEYYQQQADLYLVKAKMFEVIYANLCKEVSK